MNYLDLYTNPKNSVRPIPSANTSVYPRQVVQKPTVINSVNKNPVVSGQKKKTNALKTLLIAAFPFILIMALALYDNRKSPVSLSDLNFIFDGGERIALRNGRPFTGKVMDKTQNGKDFIARYVNGEILEMHKKDCLGKILRNIHKFFEF